VINWPTNTWTQVTPSTNPAGASGTTYTHPAVYFTGLAGVLKPPHESMKGNQVPGVRRAFTTAGPTIDLTGGMRGVAVYSLAGQSLFQYHRSQTDGTQRIGLPQSVQNAGCVIAKYDIDK
jgi:hypothetical protein